VFPGEALFRHVVHQILQTTARIPVVRVFVYGAEALRYCVIQREVPALSSFVEEYGDWRRSQAFLNQPLVARVPWITFGAIDFLNSQLRPDMRVFEYGTGGSTLFFGQHVGSVVSVEHDAAWSAQVRQAATALHLENVTILDAAPENSQDPRADPADPDAYASSDRSFAGMSFRAYAAAIDSFHDESFDLVLIDGRARPSCFKHAHKKVAPGGVLMLDNAERMHYARIEKTLADLGWPRRDFVGAGPLNKYFWKTSAWNRKA
jgi:hypothetical protein